MDRSRNEDNPTGHAHRQSPPDSLPDSLWDVLIIGAGPAGSIAALSLARNGHRVLLVDRKQFPREKVCGDGLLADTLACLRRNGLYETVKAASYVDTVATVCSPSQQCFKIEGEFLILPRELFDAILAEAACRASATFARTEVNELRNEADGQVSARLSDGHILRSRVCLVATGAGHITLSRNLNLIDDPTPYAIAGRCYVKSDKVADQITLTYDRSILPGYGWIMPLGRGRYNIGCGTRYRDDGRPQQNIRRVFQKMITHFPPARWLMAHATEVSPFRAAPLRCNFHGSRSMRVGSILAAGEAIGTTFPFSGAGIGKAMESGELAAETIHRALESGNLELFAEYPSLVASRMKPLYRGYVAAEKWLTLPWINDFMAKRIGRSTWLRLQFTRFVNECSDPRSVFSPWSIIRSYWE